LNFDLHTLEVFTIKPCNGTLGGLWIIIGNGSFSLLIPGFAVFVDPDLGFSSLLIVLDHANGSKK